ncbi:hypothetical protein [Rhodopila sp.]|uniref:hypothetical protein n=1 Tax=Rhodopila sp. TaxID=2480087 RepID=UPI003D138CA5
MSLPTNLPTTLPIALLETILTRIAPLFLIGAPNNPDAARDAAAHMLAAYHPETTQELRLAANIVAFSFQSLEALSQAATPDMSLTRVLRLRGSAVTLTRESAKAERRLAELQTARGNATTQPAETHPAEAQPAEAQPAEAQPAEPKRTETLAEPKPDTREPTPEPQIEKAIALIQDTAEIAATAEATNQSWDQAHENRQREARIAASLQRAEARVAALANTPTPSIPHSPA